MRYRAAAAQDVEAVAQLHAESWPRNYRGAYLDSFLDGDVFADRLTVWADRLTHSWSHQYTTWGALLENLHVEHSLKGRGTGTRLMSETARELLARRPATGLYLWVLEHNTKAQRFYDARGGTAVERAIRGPFPGGGTAGRAEVRVGPSIEPDRRALITKRRPPTPRRAFRSSCRPRCTTAMRERSDAVRWPI